MKGGIFINNSRKYKNIIMVIILFLCSVCIYYTMTHVEKVENNMNFNNSNMQGPPNNSNMQGPPDRKSNDSSNMQDSNESQSSDNSSNSDNEDNNSLDENDMSKPPQMNDNSNDQNRPNMNNFNNHNNSINTIYYLLFACESFVFTIIIIYLIISRFNQKTFKEIFYEKDKLIIFLLSSFLLAICLTVTESYFSKKYFLKSNDLQMNEKMNSKITSFGSTEITSTETLSNNTYSSKKNNENVILVKNKGNVTLSNITIEKEGDSSNTESSDFNGVNSSVLVEKNSTATITNAKISTNGKGANAVFSTGSNSKITISDSTITTIGSSSSRGLDATYNGKIIGKNLTITTNGASSATLATDRGEGTVTVDNSTLKTKGNGSPLIYSTGNISINKTTGEALNSQMVVVEGKNSATVTNSKLISSAKGNRNDVDNAGIMIYQSMSKDAKEGTGTFNSKNSLLQINENSDYYKTAPMFFITNTKAIINLEDTTLSYGSNELISAKATSEWGTNGSNGASVTLNAKNQELKGNINLDKLSTLDFNLSNSSFNGCINGKNTAKKITLNVSKDSKLKLTGDSYVTSFSNEDSSNSNIDFNGFKLYVNGKSIN